MTERRKDAFTQEDGVSLKEYILQRCCLCEKINNERFDAQERALKLSQTILDNRLSSMNEIREQLRTQKHDFITRVEHESLVKDIQELREFRATLQGKASTSSVYISYILGVIAIVISMIHLFK